MNCKGPVAYMWLTVQAREDGKNDFLFSKKEKVELGNWTKLCNDYGLDYISQFMLITGTTAREDGLPAPYYRTGKILESFKVFFFVKKENLKK